MVRSLRGAAEAAPHSFSFHRSVCSIRMQRMPTSQSTLYRLDPNLMDAEEQRLRTTQLPKALMINVAAIAFVLLMTLRNEPSTTFIFVELSFMGILTCWMVFN